MRTDLLDAEMRLRDGHETLGPLRGNCVFAWETLELGVRYYHSNPNRALYLISACDEDVLHVGDHDLINHLATVLKSEEEASIVVKKYWASKPGARPRLEYMLRRGRAEAVLISPGFHEDVRTKLDEDKQGFLDSLEPELDAIIAKLPPDDCPEADELLSEKPSPLPKPSMRLTLPL
jgi:succinate dehydrogenase flavin-adding protein (antitoxin of CptAB toxin-antitoxin module)